MRGIKRSRDFSDKLENANPMSYVANLMDIMLVFICGLMIAIIIFWNVDVENFQKRVEDVYEDVGQVYQDPETGKMYVISSQPTEDETVSAPAGTEG